MDISGKYITHTTFGRGKIVSLKKGIVTILFEESKTKKRFVYPSAFGIFLTLEDADLRKEMKQYQDELAVLLKGDDATPVPAAQEVAPKKAAKKAPAKAAAKTTTKTTTKPTTKPKKSQTL